MLLRVIFKNFLSFDDEVMFDMFPNMKRTLLTSHIYTAGRDIPVLKQAAIFGQNGSGKSNMVKGLEFIKTFVLNRDFLKNIDLEQFFFNLKPQSDTEPMYLAIEFEIASKYFFYEIEVLKSGVKRETLYETHPLEGKQDLIFDRQDSKVTFAETVSGDDVINKATEEMLAKNKLSSFISLNKEFPLIRDARVGMVTKWMDESLDIIGVHSVIPALIELLRKDKDIMKFAQQTVAQLQLGVDGVTLSDEEYESWAKHNDIIAKQLPSNMEDISMLSLNSNNTPILSIAIENGIRKVYQLMFENVGKNGFVGRLGASSQSDGTLRALMLLPALYFASKLGKTVVVDEINCCLSPSMVKGLVGYFANMEDTNGQLIFTTHDVQLLDEKSILRSDEVWFVDKKYGASIMYSHNDFKEHHSISMYNGYNEGRFGAIRFINLA
jgi:AAA15 family ATPase/GTPase